MWPLVFVCALIEVYRLFILCRYSTIFWSIVYVHFPRTFNANTNKCDRILFSSTRKTQNCFSLLPYSAWKMGTSTPCARQRTTWFWELFRDERSVPFLGLIQKLWYLHHLFSTNIDRLFKKIPMRKWRLSVWFVCFIQNPKKLKIFWCFILIPITQLINFVCYYFFWLEIQFFNKQKLNDRNKTLYSQWNTSCKYHWLDLTPIRSFFCLIDTMIFVKYFVDSVRRILLTIFVFVCSCCFVVVVFFSNLFHFFISIHFVYVFSSLLCEHLKE